MSWITENGFHVVYDVEVLRRVVTFLELGFGWDKPRSKEILERLEPLDSDTPKAAFFADNNEIKIAILLFDQTTTQNSTHKVINLSAWYAKESHRGIDAIRFAKLLTAKLADYTITNYTASAAVAKILTSFGFKYMSVEVFPYGAIKNFPFFRIKNIQKNFSFFSKSVKPVKLVFDSDRDVPHAGYGLVIIKKFGFNFRVLNIYLEKDVRSISLGWVLKKCLCNCVLRVNIYAETSSSSKQSPWLIKSLGDDLFVYPENAELSISH